MSEHKLNDARGVRVWITPDQMYSYVGPTDAGYNCIRLTAIGCDGFVMLLIPATNKKMPCMGSVIGWTMDTIFARCPSCEKTWEFDNALKLLPCFR
jgi:hypothetical protein